MNSASAGDQEVHTFAGQYSTPPISAHVKAQYDGSYTWSGPGDPVALGITYGIYASCWCDGDVSDSDPAIQGSASSSAYLDTNAPLDVFCTGTMVNNANYNFSADGTCNDLDVEIDSTWTVEATSEEDNGFFYGADAGFGPYE